VASLSMLLANPSLFAPYLLLYHCHGTGAVATKRMYSRSLQDVARSIVRVKGVRR